MCFVNITYIQQTNLTLLLFVKLNLVFNLRRALNESFFNVAEINVADFSKRLLMCVYRLIVYFSIRNRRTQYQLQHIPVKATAYEVHIKVLHRGCCEKAKLT